MNDGSRGGLTNKDINSVLTDFGLGIKRFFYPQNCGNAREVSHIS
jgi:hypothetical protein